jgi:putative ATP-binding cassette transporter
MMSLALLRFLLRHSRRTMLVMVGAGIASGLLSIGVVALINHALHARDALAPLMAAGFALLVAAKIASAASSQLLLTRFSQGTILDLSLSLCNQILRAPLRRLEREGSGRILAVLTDDVSTVTWAVQCIPKLATNLAVVLGCGLYLAWLSWQMFLWAAAVTLLGAAIYKAINERAFSIIVEAREARSRLFEHFRTLTSGIKELMMHRARREEYVETQLRPAGDDYRRSNLEATIRHTLAEAWVQFLLYALIGILIFAYPAVNRPPVETLTGYVFAILYVMGPLWAIIGTLPAVMRGQVALQKIQDLGMSLEPYVTPVTSHGRELPAASAGSAVEMKRVTFQYEATAGEEAPFVLGPIDFRLAPGELVFVVGGNGSGKSTFAKVLTGLYTPQSGALLIGGAEVTPQTQEAYRENFSAMFSDFHLFEKLLGIASPDLEAATRQYLRLLQIDGKVSLQERGFSTVDLSQGQRKRLALVTAYLEDRPFYLFDEWAADQDPEYKQIFYSKLLPELRQRGKGVVVITHDDRYFSLGDRVVKLEEGKVVAGDWTDELRSAATH